MRLNDVRRFAWTMLAGIALLIPGGLLPGGTAPLAADAPGVAFPDTTTVDGNGAATFTLPLALPQGTGGLTPKLSLTYSSHQDDGLLGVGWMLSGTHTVARCAPTIAQDGHTGGVTFTTQDRFCLDGQRLVPIEGGAQGGDQTVYRTEVDGFVKVVSYWNGGQSCGGGPCSFKAFAGNGTVVTFGTEGTGFAGVGAPPGVVAVWAVRSITDSDGNFITFDYQSQSATGEYQLTGVTYSGVGLTDTRGVDFTYEPNAPVEAVTRYQGGVATTTTVRLKQIVVKTTIGGQASPVATYSIGYETGPTTGRSRIATVTECGRTGQCAAPLALAWSDPAGTAGGPAYTATSGIATNLSADQANDLFFAADFVGDGRSGLARINTQSGLVDVLTYNPSGGTFTKTPWRSQPSSQCASAALVGDFNGDGPVDILCIGVYGSTFSGTTYSTDPRTGGVVTTAWKPQNSPSTSNKRFLSSDVNGDGITDLVLLGVVGQNLSVTSYLGQPSGVSGQPVGGPSTPARFTSLATAGIEATDLTGDGTAELVYPVVSGSTLQLQVVPDLTNPAATARSWALPGIPTSVASQFDLTFGDLNGDGIQDLVGIFDSTGGRTVKRYLATGTELNEVAGTIAFGQQVASVVVEDFNGDHMADFGALRQYGSGGQLSVVLSGGSATPQTWATFTQPLSTTSPVLQGDFTGRGFADMVQLTVRSGSWQAETFFGAPYTVAGLSEPPPPDTLVSVANGVGATTTLTYAPLSNTYGPVYAKGTASAYPYQDVQDATYVVSRLDRSDGMVDCAGPDAAGHCFTYTYAYAGAVTNLEGRGWSGFTSVTSFDPQAERASVTVYETQFPFTHLATDQQMRAILGDRLVPMKAQPLVKQSCTMSTGGTPVGTRTDGAPADCAQQAATPAKAFFPGVYQVQQVAELSSMYPNPDGNAPDPQPAYTLVETYAYDGFGNVTLVSDLGDAADADSAPVYTCATYNAPPTDLSAQGQWRLGYVIDHKMRMSAAGCLDGSAFAGWTPGTDLTWERNGYDGSWQVLYSARFLDARSPDARNATCAAPVAGGTWLCTSYGYDAYGNVTASTDPQGATETFGFDATFHTFPVTRTSPPVGGGDTLTVSRTFDLALGVVLSTTDPNGNTTGASYDDFGRPLAATAPSPTDGSQVQTTAVSYAAGTPAGWTTTTSSCTDWRDCGQASDAWSWTSVSYDGMGREYATVRKGAAGDGPVVLETVAFDAAGRVAARSLPYFADTGTAALNRTDYDVYDRPVLTCGPPDAVLGTSTVQTWIYDNAARTTTRNTYSAASCAASTSEARSLVQTTVSSYDTRGRTLRTTAPDGGVGTFAYDGLSRIVERVGPLDSNGSDTTVYAYDSLSRTTSQSDPTRGTIALAYDALGNVVSTRDSAGNTVTQTFDALSRPLERTLVDAGDVAVETSTFGYDTGANAKGRMSSAANATVAHTMAYDRMGNQSAFTTTEGGTTFSFGALFDPLGRETAAVGADGSVVETVYGADLNLQSVNYCAAGESAFRTIAAYGDYTALGRYQTRSYGNGLASRFSYDVVGRLTASTATSGTTDLSSMTYAWGAQDNPVNVLSRITDTLAAGQSQTLGYDVMGRLTSAAGPYPDTALTYDAGGNITSWRTGSQTTIFETDPAAAYRLSGSETGTGRDTYDYLGNGALSARTGGGGADAWAYAYDPEAMLTGVSLNGGDVSDMAYGPDKSLAVERDADGTTTVWLGPGLHRTAADTGTLWTTSISGPDGIVATITTDGFTPSAGQSTCLAALGSTTAGSRKADAGAPGWPVSGATVAAAGAVGLPGGLILLVGGWRRRDGAGAWLRRTLVALLASTVALAGTPWPAHADLVPGPNGAGIEQTGIRYFHRDTVLSPNLVTDADGKETARVAYLPFGGLNEPSSAGVDDFREKFGGRDQIATTGLLNFGARVYDPALGRFLTPDPAGQFDNPYSYAGNDPFGHADPDGRFSTEAYFGGAGLTHQPPATAAGGGAASFSPGKVLLHIGEAVALIAISVAFPEVGVAIGVAFAAYDAVKFVRDPSLENGLALGFDVVTLGFGGEADAAEAGIEDAVHSEGAGMEATKGDEPLDSGLANDGHDGQQKAPGGDEASCGAASFAGGTPVRTRGGPVAIEDLRVGDEVLAGGDPADAAWRPVTRLYSRVAEDALDLTVGGETLRTTARHPFLVEGGDWTEAAELRPGRTVVRADGTAAEVTEVRPVGEAVRVYNLEVADLHVYAVGEDGVLAHNVLTVTCAYDPNGRKTTAQTTITQADLDTGTGTNKTTRDFVKDEAGFTKLSGGKYDPNSGLTDEFPDAGHIFANRLGGSGRDVENIFPQSRSINRGQYRVFEGQVYDYVDTNGTVSARVDFIYEDSTAVASEVRYRVYQGNKKVFDVTFGNYTSF
ncbi:polymorphic toxin-type HINT domain-containing protein [Arenibaculum sp.]|uniref:polymorphic toxin-type HINT domain-containing protein n=1 Tax=Arenibaculum sp. TaxID=2865862 RepID=UPI002E0F0E5D|nr:polymorphic toxin-type HINT domain-containing protein [Arenibaculum sp.]